MVDLCHGEAMTPPMTPREKVRQIIDDALNSAIPEPWEVANHATDRIFTALASGSGDHAELERLAEAATPGPWSYRDMTPNTYGPAFVDSAEVQSLAICGEAVGLSETHGFCLQVDSEVRMANAAFIAAANPATVLALLSEIAALRGEVETLTTSGIIEVAVRNPSVADYVQHWEGRATQAERQRDELRRALEPFAKAAGKLDGLWSEDDWRWNDSVRSGVTVRDIRRASQVLANQGADQ